MKFSNLFGKPIRKSESDLLTQFHMDIASSIQAVIEEVILKMTKKLSQEYKLPNLCMAGGVALNCVANAKILKAGHFKNLWVQPAAGDAGGALGGALLAWHKKLDKPRTISKCRLDPKLMYPLLYIKLYLPKPKTEYLTLGP